MLKKCGNGGLHTMKEKDIVEDVELSVNLPLSNEEETAIRKRIQGIASMCFIYQRGLFLV